MIRVLIADDHALVRRGLVQVLTSLSDIEVVGEVATGSAVLTTVQSTRPDVLLLDINMPAMNFLDTLGALREHEPRVRTLIVSAHAEAMYARRAIQAGACGYITKERSEEELITAIRLAARGGRYVSEALAQELVAELAAGTPAAPHHALTRREHEMLLLLAAGHTVTHIADRLGLSVKTVSTHRTRLLAKLHLSTNAELMQYARAHALIE